MQSLSITKICANVLAATLLCGPLASMSQAQGTDLKVKVNVPFDFENGSQHFRAGVYTITSPQQHTLLVRGNSDNGMALMMVSDDTQRVDEGKVVFHRYGDQYFLSKVYVAGSARHIEMIKSRQEKQSERDAREARRPVGNVALLELPR